MNKPFVSLVLVMLLVASLVIATAAAASEPEEVIITPWMDGQEYTIGPGQLGVIRAGWGACSRGLVQAYINASNYELSLNDTTLLTPEQVDELWGPMGPFVPAPPNEDACPGNTKPMRASWQYPLTDLAPGTYTLHTLIWIDHPLIDGGDYDGDGKPDLFTPENLYYNTENTIIVVEP